MNLKILLSAFIISLPFWWGINVLEANLKDFLFWNEISQNPQIFTAQIALEEKLQNTRPVRDAESEDLKIEAKSTISIFIDDNGKNKILFEKDAEQKLPIASLTKLMTARVVLEYYDLSKEIEISQKSVAQKEDFGKLTPGRVFPTGYLLYPLLMESSNDAAFALATDYNGMTEAGFAELMNWEAEKMNLKNTYFFNSSGLEPDNRELNDQINYSTAADLVLLTKNLLREPLIWEILSTPEYTLYGPELVNTNQLLSDESFDWQDRIVGGKTGYTEKAGQCMLLVLRAPKNQGFIVNVVLGSNDRFEEMKKLVNWLEETYKW